MKASVQLRTESAKKQVATVMTLGDRVSECCVIDHVKQTAKKYQRRGLCAYLVIFAGFITVCIGNVVYAYQYQRHTPPTSVGVDDQLDWKLPNLVFCFYGGDPFFNATSSWSMVSLVALGKSSFKPGTTFLDWFELKNSTSCSSLQDPSLGYADCLVVRSHEMLLPSISKPSSPVQLVQAGLLMQDRVGSASIMSGDIRLYITNKGPDKMCSGTFSGDYSIQSFTLVDQLSKLARFPRFELNFSLTKRGKMRWAKLRNVHKGNRRVVRYQKDEEVYDFVYGVRTTPILSTVTGADVQTVVRNAYPILNSVEERAHWSTRQYANPSAWLDRKPLWENVTYPRLLELFAQAPSGRSIGMNVLIRQQSQVLTSDQHDPVSWFGLLSAFGGYWQYVALFFGLLFISTKWDIRQPRVILTRKWWCGDDGCRDCVPFKGFCCGCCRAIPENGKACFESTAHSMEELAAELTVVQVQGSGIDGEVKIVHSKVNGLRHTVTAVQAHLGRVERKVGDVQAQVGMAKEVSSVQQGLVNQEQ